MRQPPHESDPLHAFFADGRVAGRANAYHRRARAVAGCTPDEIDAWDLGYSCGEAEASADTGEFDAMLVRAALADATAAD